MSFSLNKRLKDFEFLESLSYDAGFFKPGRGMESSVFAGN
jgi:hypothetical protein